MEPIPESVTLSLARQGITLLLNSQASKKSFHLQQQQQQQQCVRVCVCVCVEEGAGKT